MPKLVGSGMLASIKLSLILSRSEFSGDTTYSFELSILTGVPGLMTFGGIYFLVLTSDFDSSLDLEADLDL